jgi:hypothetical protein
VWVGQLKANIEDDPYISDHDPSERPQEYRIATHESKEASCPIIPQIRSNSAQVQHETKKKKQ